MAENQVSSLIAQVLATGEAPDAQVSSLHAQVLSAGGATTALVSTLHMMVASAVETGLPVFDPRTSVNVTISPDGKTITGTANNDANQGGKADGALERSTGKVYFEAQFINTPSQGGNYGAGVTAVMARQSFNTIGDNAGNSAMAYNSGNIWTDGSNRGQWAGNGASRAFFAIDLDAHLIWVRNNGSLTWNNNSSADPVTGVGGINLGPNTNQGAAYIPTFVLGGGGSNGQTGTLALSQGDFTGTAPAGFAPWAASAPVVEPPAYQYDAIGYEGFGGSGARMAIFSNTVQVVGPYGVDPKRMFAGYPGDNSFYWTRNGDGIIAGRSLTFSFPSRRIITELTLYCDSPGGASNMVWSFDAFDVVADAWVSLASFGYTTAGPIVVPVASDGVPYAGYRLNGISGGFADEHWWRNLEFKTSYQIGESGNRSSIITTTQNVTSDQMVGTFAKFFDGAIGSDTNNSWYFKSSPDVAGYELEWEFTDGPRTILAAYHGTNGNSGNNQGQWKLQAWDGAAWQDLLAFTWLMDNATPWGPITSPVEAARYRLLGVSGTADQYHWENELYFEFAQPTDTPPAEDIELEIAFSDDGGLSGALTTYTVEPPEDDIIFLPMTFADDGGLAAVITTNKPIIRLRAATMRDDEGISLARLTNGLPYTGFTLKATFTDDEGIARAFLKRTPMLHLKATFNDEATLRAYLGVVPAGMAGPFFFNWADQGQEFSPGLVLDTLNAEDMFSFQVQQTEGDFASASVVLRNPRVGLLSAGRKRWAWISGLREGTIHPLFFGRVLGLPNNIFEELVTFEFVARPHDFTEQKAALAESLRVMPWFDHLFVDPDSWIDDDAVLEARTANWHTDRVTHLLTISDIINAEDGVVEFTEADYFYDGLQVMLGQAPLRSVTIQSTIPWNLEASAGFNLSDQIRLQFGDATGLISSFTFEGLQSSWPKQGQKVGDGWTAISGQLIDVSFTAVPEYKVGPPFDASTIPQAVPEGSFVYPIVITDGEYHSGEDAGYNINVEQVIVPIGYGVPDLSVEYTAKRNMGQYVVFNMKTDVQDVLTLAPESDNKIVTVNANLLTDLGPDGLPYIPDSRIRDFIRTPRGQLAIKHLLLVARANLAHGGRVVESTFDIPFWDNLRITLRKAAFIHNKRLPGGEAIGKITAYSFGVDGSSGTAYCSVTMKSSVGRGGAYQEVEGEPTYIEDDYITKTYYEREGRVIALPAGDVAFSYNDFVPFDDGVDFRSLNASNIVKTFFVQNPATVQLGELSGWEGADQGTISAVLSNIPTMFTIGLLPMSGGPFQGNEGLNVADLVLPKQIDLEAASNGE